MAKLPGFLISLDTETGGTRPASNYSLLEVGAVAATIDGSVMDEIELAIQPENGIYRVTERAMAINGIDLSAHAERAMPAERAAQLLVAFVAPYSPDAVLVGWNVGFDREYIETHLLDVPTVGKLFGYRVFDLHGAMLIAASANRMPYTKSLQETARFFGLLGDDEKQEHRALADAHLAVQVYNRMRDFLR